MNEDQLIFKGPNGEDVIMEIVFTYDCEDNGKSYVFFCPPEMLDSGEEVQLLCASYTEGANGEIANLRDIESDEEWEMLSEVLEEFSEAEFEEE